MPDDRPLRSDGVFQVSMVCTGNICRSPMAEVVLRDLVHKGGLDDRIAVTSAATGDWHVGEKADPRTVEALARRGYNGRSHRARQFDPSWFDGLDLVIALDRSHERILRAWALNDSDRSKIRLLASFDPDSAGISDVPDPYYSDRAMFDQVLTTIERGCRALFSQLEPALRHQNAPGIQNQQTSHGHSAPAAPAAPTTHAEPHRHARHNGSDQPSATLHLNPTATARHGETTPGA